MTATSNCHSLLAGAIVTVCCLADKSHPLRTSGLVSCRVDALNGCPSNPDRVVRFSDRVSRRRWSRAAARGALARRGRTDRRARHASIRRCASTVSWTGPSISRCRHSPISSRRFPMNERRPPSAPKPGCSSTAISSPLPPDAGMRRRRRNGSRTTCAATRRRYGRTKTSPCCSTHFTIGATACCFRRAIRAVLSREARLLPRRARHHGVRPIRRKPGQRWTDLTPSLLHEADRSQREPGGPDRGGWTADRVRREDQSPRALPGGGGCNCQTLLERGACGWPRSGGPYNPGSDRSDFHFPRARFK